MKKCLIVLTIAVVFVPAALAQDTPKADVHIGYVLGIVDTGDSELTNGLGFNVHVPFNDTLGVAFDLTTNWGSVFGISFNTQTFLGGIRFTKRGEKADGFFHVMGGMARIGVLGFSATDPALGIGGGFDVRMKDNLYYRVVQVDYVPVFSDGETVNNFKIQTGIQFRF